MSENKSFQSEGQLLGSMFLEPSCIPQANPENLLAADQLSRCLMPGTLTLLCGNPGASKSFMLLQLLWHLIEGGISSAVLELEESRAFHTLRALAQRCKAAGLTDPEWIATHPEAARQAYSENEMFIRKVSQAITATGLMMPTAGRSLFPFAGNRIAQQPGAQATGFINLDNPAKSARLRLPLLFTGAIRSYTARLTCIVR